MSDDKTVEQVARALCRFDGRDPDAPRPGLHEPTWLEYEARAIQSIEATRKVAAGMRAPN